MKRTFNPEALMPFCHPNNELPPEEGQPDIRRVQEVEVRFEGDDDHPFKTYALAGGGPIPAIRQFDTGATRDIDNGKLDYEAFISPAVLERYARFMHKNRHQKDGTLRDGDNWQKGIPIEAYQKSLIRHVMEAWNTWRGRPTTGFEDTLCAIMFNVMGLLHETMKEDV